MSSLYALPEHLQQRLSAELKPGESVSWAGRPVPAQYMKSGFMLWLFFIPWTAFSIFWIAGAADFKVPDFSDPSQYFPVFGVPFLLIGIGGLSSPLRMWLKAHHTIYAVTNQRALTIEGRRSVKVRSFPPAEIASPTRREKADGSGDLVLKTELVAGSKGSRRKEDSGFFAVPEVKGAERAVDKLLARA